MGVVTPYAPQAWVDDITDVDAAHMLHIEAGLANAVQAPTGLAAGEVPVWTGAGWERSSVQKIQKASLGALGIVNADVDAAAAIALSKLAGYPTDATKFARGDGTWAVPPAGSSSIIAKTKRTTVVSTTATSFATGADVFASALSFTADGTSDYALRLSTDYFYGNTANLEAVISLNLDGSNYGAWGFLDLYAANKGAGVTFTYCLVAPSAGVHTANGRLYITFGGPGTMTMDAGAGNLGLPGSPILLTIEKLP